MIDAILEADHQVPRKQRNTANRVFERMRGQRGFDGGYTTVKGYVWQRRRTREMFVPLASGESAGDIPPNEYMRAADGYGGVCD